MTRHNHKKMTRRNLRKPLSTLTCIAMLSLTLLLQTYRADATNWNSNIQPGSDIMMSELRWPEWDAGTYYCFLYCDFTPKYAPFYGGMAVHGPDKTPGLFTSYWGVTATIYEGDGFYGKGFGAEGSKGGANGSPKFQRPNSWYRMVLRTFPPTQDGDKKTNVGWWIKDVEKNKWYTHSILQIPSMAKGFSGCGGFVEPLAPRTVHRKFERRLGYGRLDGKWYDAPLSANEATKFKLIKNDTVVRFDRSDGDTGGHKKERTFFRTKQPTIPVLDKPVIDQPEAQAWGNQVSVTWKIPQSASPQLGYKLEAFAGSGAKGKQLATWEDAAPHISNKRLDTKVLAKSVRLTVTDIFDQQIAVVIPVKSITIPTATTSKTKTRAGLHYVYYEDPTDLKKGTWKKLPDFSILKPIKQGYVKDLDDTVREDRRAGYALSYKGYLRVPADGLYVISAGTSDGSQLYVDGTLIAENDGIHSTSQKLYSFSLRKGLRAFELKYFKGAESGNSRQSTTAKISISWEGPNFELRKLTKDDFMCDVVTEISSATLALKSAVSAGVLEDNMAYIQVAIDRRKQSFQKLQLFAGKVLLTSKFADDIDKKGNVNINVLLPEGENQVWARLWFDDGHSIDSANELVIEAKNQTIEPWQFTSMLKGGFPLAVRSDADSASFMGEGLGFVHQTVEGDFTLTARIADMPLSSKENGLHAANWLGLSIASKHSNPKVRLTDGNPYTFIASISLTAGGKMKGPKDFPDLGGSNMSVASFEGDHRWLKMVRRGRRYQSFTSADGKTWQLAGERFSATKAVYAGVCFRSVPNKSRSLFQGAVDHIKLVNNVSQEEREKPRKEDLNLNNRITALVQAPKNPEILYARSVGKGLFKSKDQGETWAAVNGRLSAPEALAVRSVAVHPENSSIVLRAGGSVVKGKLKSGIWRSKNGGESWKLVTREIDFDGSGPTSFFGEVMMFSPHEPDLVVAAGETKGLFISRDAGVTWNSAGLTGERITSMAFSSQLEKKANHPVLIVGTFSDSEFQTLGLGQPVTPVEEPGRVYWVNIPTDATTIKGRKTCELKDFGITNIVSDSDRKFVNFATTRGVYYTWCNGGMYAKRMVGTSNARLFTAIGARTFDDWSRLTCAAPFSGNEQSPVYFTNKRSRDWAVLSDKTQIKGQQSGGGGLHLNAGISCILPDVGDKNTLYLCNRHGVFKTTDQGKFYKLVLPSSNK